MQDRTHLDAVAAADLFNNVVKIAVNIGVAALADLIETLLQREGGLLFLLTANLIVDSIALYDLHIGSPFRDLSPLVVLNIPYVSYVVNISL